MRKVTKNYLSDKKQDLDVGNPAEKMSAVGIATESMKCFLAGLYGMKKELSHDSSSL